MCRKSPYPRCSDHAVKTLRKVMEEHEVNPSQLTHQSLQTARKDYLLSPAGIKMLRKQGKEELASKCAKQRKTLNADASRFLKYSTDVETVHPQWHGDVNLRPNLSSPAVEKAYVLAVSAHAGIRRRSGEPYINHPLRTAKHLENMGYNEEVVAVALLHDAVEDSSLTIEDLRTHGFNERIVSGVDSVTKRLGETYSEAIARACSHPIGRLVKLSDNLDNSSAEQLKPFTEEKKAKQIRKYEPARKTLILAIHRGNRLKDYLNPSAGFVGREYSLKG